ncbi:MAG TPA: hypothetical protein ENO16_04775 [Chromatiales bacterium]|nr:hypothetical protein [Chromatiales bacterium]
MPSPFAGILLLALGLVLAAPARADDRPDDRVALQGLDTARVVWDVTTADPHRMSAHLALVEQTWEDLLRQKVRTEMVFAFREGSVRLLSEQAGLLPFELETEAEQLRERLARLARLPGVRMEACAISMRGHGVKKDALPPWVNVVGNTFNSIIGRAPRGFAVITLP